MRGSGGRWAPRDTDRLRPAPPGLVEQRLLARLEALGVRAVERLRLTENRSVLVSYSRRRVLSLHRAYSEAPDRVLSAIVRFIAPGTPRAGRKRAERVILAYPIPGRAAPARRTAFRRERAEDAAVLRRLRDRFDALNARHFGGSLPRIRIVLSRRMRSRLGQLTLDPAGAPTDLTISHGHLVAHGWAEVERTLLHEMVHLWQHANGHPVDHGRQFRTKAMQVGAHPAARRWLALPDRLRRRR